jgi:hypothetical protein
VTPAGTLVRQGRWPLRNRAALGSAVFVLLAVACAPKAEVTVKPPEEPIVINLNVKIEHEIRVKVDKDLESAFENDDLF